MTALPELNRAEPGNSLLSRDDTKRLGLCTASWDHLNRYIANVEAVPAELQGISAESAAALSRLRSLAQVFGTPKQLRQLIQDRPDALAEGPFPSTLYAGAAWMVHHLHQSAASFIAILRNFTSSAKSAGDLRSDLQRLGADAENARKAIGPLAAGLKSFKTEITNANAALSAAYRADADTLQRLQEQLGSLQVKVTSVTKEIGQLGFFSAGKKHEREQQLETLQQQQRETSIRSEKLRAALAAIEPILNEGFWLEPGIDDLVSFLGELRQVLTRFGSSMTQLAADASDAQLRDAAGMQTLFSKEASIQQWDAIAAAAAQYLAKSALPVATKESL